MTSFAELLVELRKQKDLSQQDVAKALGVSQATISRIEKGENYPSDIRQLAKLAKLHDVPMSDLLAALPDGFSATASGDSPFFAFCPNPLCDSNQLLRENGSDYVKWTSGHQHAAILFDEINFCDSCGAELIKDCKNCRKPLSRLAKFCVKCGERIYMRPTPEEWKKINKILDRQQKKDDAPATDDDIPF